MVKYRGSERSQLLCNNRRSHATRRRHETPSSRFSTSSPASSRIRRMSSASAPSMASARALTRGGASQRHLRGRRHQCRCGWALALRSSVGSHPKRLRSEQQLSEGPSTRPWFLQPPRAPRPSAHYRLSRVGPGSAPFPHRATARFWTGCGARASRALQPHTSARPLAGKAASPGRLCSTSLRPRIAT